MYLNGPVRGRSLKTRTTEPETGCGFVNNLLSETRRGAFIREAVVHLCRKAA